MSKARRTRYAKERRDPGSFVALAHVVIRSPQFAALSAHAVKLLMDLLAQYRGNNGDLCATWSMMHKRGWKSRDTLAKALRELIGRGFVSQTRQGGLHAASLYGVTFYALDEHEKLDVRASGFPRSEWQRVAADDTTWCERQHAGRANSRRKRQHAGRVNSLSVNTSAVSPRVSANAN